MRQCAVAEAHLKLVAAGRGQGGQHAGVDGGPHALHQRAQRAFFHTAHGAGRGNLQAAKNMGTPDDAHGTAAHQALDELLTVLDA
ncbi:hypothetical protein [Hydrogenophaga sp. NFH-34]|uniref:hypothetical protein n=1 Tax=Hydrogenophaga sp. NFH-34 TaxID=2744446 RepID=UPI001F3BF9C1